MISAFIKPSPDKLPKLRNDEGLLDRYGKVLDAIKSNSNEFLLRNGFQVDKLLQRGSNLAVDWATIPRMLIDDLHLKTHTSSCVLKNSAR